MDTIGVGVIGCGFVGYGAHVPAFHGMDGAKLVAVADADPKRRGKAEKKYGVKTYGDYSELVQDPEIQAVVVAVPTPLHAAAALAAIEAGKHVLCEMPLATTLDEAHRIVEAAAARGVTLMPSLTFRFTPTFLKVKQLLEEGRLGEPSAAVYREFIPAGDLARQWPPGSWMWDLPSSGGPLFTLAVWSIDLLRWLFDSEIAAVHGAVKYTTLERFGGTLGYDASATLSMESGVVASLQYSGSVCPSGAACTLEVVGSSTHSVKANENESVLLLAEDPFKTEWYVKEPGARMWGHVQQDEHFVAALREGKEPCISPADGLLAMEVAMKIAQPQ